MKKIIGCFVALSLLLTGPNSARAGFSDIREGSQLEIYVNYLSQKKIIAGYPDGSFKPDQIINRAEALKIIFETIGISDFVNCQLLHVKCLPPFPDVPSNEWFSTYVSEAKKRNLIQGYPDGKFRPNQDVNRAEFIKMAVSSLPMLRDFSTAFRCASFRSEWKNCGDTWYAPYVDAGIEFGLLSKSNDFRPTESMKRQDAAEIIYRLSKYLEAEIPYITEEELIVNDPALEHIYEPEEFGAEKLIIKKDINFTEINNFFHEYDLRIEQIVDVSALENSPHEIRIEFPQGCLVDIYVTENNEGFSAAEYYKNNFPQIGDANMYQVKSSKLSKLSEYPQIEAYKVNTTWKGQDPSESYFIYTDKKIFTPHAISFGKSDKKDCRNLTLKIISAFNLHI